MKKHLLLIIFVFAIPLSAQSKFSIEKFVNEKVAKLEPDMEINMDDLLQKAVDAKFDGVDIKVAHGKSSKGNVVIKSISNKNEKVGEASKLNKSLKKKLLTLLGKPSKENVVDNVDNTLWLLKDGTRYILTYSGNLAMLVVMKK